MGSQEGVMSIKPPLFNGSNLIFQKVRTKAYLQSLGADVWAIVEEGYQYPASIPTDAAENEEDKSGIDSCSCYSLSGVCNSEDTESNSLDLEEAIKIKFEDAQ